MKLTLFFCAGFIHVETHTDYISEMDGIGKRMPLTMVAFAVAAAGMAGIPLVAGFVSKWFILIGAVEAGGGQTVFAVVLLVSGVLNIAYFWPIVYGAFFESHDDADDKPLAEGPLGGRLAPSAADTRSEPVPDGGEPGAEGEDHGGPGEGGWDRVGWTGGEGSWLMLGPILAIVAGAVVLGVVPYEAVFLELIDVIVEGVFS
jgi:NADH-quinone oxidoreductase subunit L/multicomponent Na+:H+ antiporter subunit D